MVPRLSSRLQAPPPPPLPPHHHRHRHYHPTTTAATTSVFPQASLSRVNHTPGPQSISKHWEALPPSPQTVFLTAPDHSAGTRALCSECIAGVLFLCCHGNLPIAYLPARRSSFRGDYRCYERKKVCLIGKKNKNTCVFSSQCC